MKNKCFFAGIVSILLIFGLLGAGCGQSTDSMPIIPIPPPVTFSAVTFTNLTANGSPTATTTKLTLTFDKDIDGLNAADIALDAGSTRAVKGTLTRTGMGVYDLAVRGISSGGSVTVAVSKSGYTITGGSKTVMVYHYTAPTDITAMFTGLSADGSSTATTTKLTLTFDKDITGLNAADIALDGGSTGASKGSLTRTEAGIYDLAVSGITSTGSVTVAVSKSGYTITGELSVMVYHYTAPTDMSATFTNLTADGSSTATTTKLTLTFDKDITGLSAADVALDGGFTGAVKGSLTRTGAGIYDLAVSGITSSGSVTVAVSKPGYTITGGSKTVMVYHYTAPTDISVMFTNLTANGSPTVTTTKLTLTFDKDITGLSAADIALDGGSTGASKGSLTRTETGVYDLAISGISSSGSVTVSVSKSGYNITGGSKTVMVYHYTAPTDITATFTGLSADGSATATTSKLTLTFDKDISGLSAADIALDGGFTGAVKGTLTRTGTGIYNLAVSGITSTGSITVAVSKSGYNITGELSVMVYHYTAPTDINATFTGLSADGSATATTSKLTLTFDKDISGLSAADIALDGGFTGAVKGTLTRTGTGIYNLAVSGITSGGSVTVAVSKSGYAITNESKTVTIYHYTAPTDISVTFTGISADGSATATTSKLTLTFDKDITGLSAADIALDGGSTGASKGSLTRTGTGVYNLAVSGITSGGSVTVAVSKSGYNITGGSKTVTVYYRIITFTVDAIPAHTYTGSAIRPTVTVRDGSTLLTLTTDYTVTYANNINAGTATVTISGAGNYAGSSGSKTFTINPKVITFTIDAIAAQTYTGSAHTPAVTVRDGSTILTPNTDYTVTGYTNNTNAGTASVTISGTGNYAGSSGSVTFTILQTVSPDRIEYYWVDQHGSLVTTSGGAVTIATYATLTITAQSSGYTVKQWHVDGVNTGQSGNTYNFSSTIAGKHTVGLFVEKGGNLYNTNIVITVTLLPRTIKIDMYDSSSDGWDHNGALRISVNGTYIPNVRLASGGSGTYTFQAISGDVVNMYWTGNTGSYHNENAFIVYYADTPPYPSFNTTSWSGSNALLFKLRNSLSNANLNQLLGSFTVQ